MMIGYNVDLATALLYAFWIFFAGLIWYLHRENKREGYPLVSENPHSKVAAIGYPAPPPSKSYRMANGETFVVEGGRPDTRAIAAKAASHYPGTPLDPTGDPMVDGVGPGAWAERSDHEDMTHEGLHKIVPLRVATGFYLETRDPDPRGMAVKGADGAVGGTIKDVWVDRSEYIARYLEVDLPGGAGSVLLPVNFSRIDGDKREVRVSAVLGQHFAKAPRTKNADSVTLLKKTRFAASMAQAHSMPRLIARSLACERA